MTGTEACLHLIDTLLTTHKAEAGDGPTVALFKASTVYVLPRISADGGGAPSLETHRLHQPTFLPTLLIEWLLGADC